MMKLERFCKKCWEDLDDYVTCYACDATYHPKCLSDLTGFFVNEQGFMFCCGDIQEEKPIVQSEELLENIKVEQNETSVTNPKLKPVKWCSPEEEKLIVQSEGSLENIKIEQSETSGCCNFIHIFDSKVEMGIVDRAKKTIPKNVLEVKELPFDDRGVFALRNIPEYAYFGPYEGLETLKTSDGFYVWRIMSGKLIDVKAEEQSNWLRYVNCVDDVNIYNLTAFQYNNQIYYKTLKEIYAGQELLLYFRSDPLSLEDNVIEYFCPGTQQLKEDTYNCISCSYGFSEEQLLVTHKKVCPYDKNELIELNVQKEISICATCNIEFSNAKHYAEHKAVCRKYICSNEKKLQTPKLSHKAGKNWCPICKRSFKCRANLINHNRIHNVTRTKDFLCLYCKKSFFYKGDLNVHVNDVHTRNKKYKCSYCEYVTSKSSSLKRHKLFDHDVRIKKFKCKHCPYVSLSSKRFSYHMYKHSIKTEVMDLNSGKDNDQVLNERLHEEKLTEENNSTIKGQSKLKRHRRKKEEKEYDCPHCKRVYFSQCGLNAHISAIHFNKKYKCVQCSFVTPWQSSIRTHTLAHHSRGQSVLRCFQCDYVTKVKQRLRSHLYTHMTDKPYKCEYENCIYQSCTALNLRQHVMRAHTFEKPFQCDICDSKFITKYNLKEHVCRKHSEHVL